MRKPRSSLTDVAMEAQSDGDEYPAKSAECQALKKKKTYYWVGKPLNR